MLSRESKKKLSAFLHALAQRVPGITLIFIWVLGFIGPPFIPYVFWVVVMIMHVFLVTNAVRLAFGLVITAVKTKKYVTTDWHKQIEDFKNEEHISDLPVRIDQVRHIIIIPNYKEEMETLMETLETLANHDLAKSAYKVILAMEEGEKGCEQKAEKLINLFSAKFFKIYFTVHPSGIPGEARGKSSNEAWATRYYAKNWMVPSENRFEIFTIMDADSHLSQKYFECMTFKYCTSTEEQQGRMLFAPTLIFDRNANKVPFVVRLADFCWSIGLMSNFQLPVKFPCSVYSVAMLLAQKVDYWDAGPEAIGEDIHMALKCWTRTRMRLRFCPIYIPASCSNVQADTYMQTIKGRYDQSKRHLWGCLDFGYTIASLITRSCWTAAPLRSLLAIYILFEIFFQPYFGFFHLFGQLLYPASAASGIGAWVIEYTTYIRLALIPPALVVAFAYERYHLICCEYRAGILKAVAEKRKASLSSEEVLSGVEMGSVEENGFAIANVSSAPGESEVAFRKWYQIFDWAGLPFALFAYYMIPGINAMIGQLFTNRLDYKVSLKPTAKPAMPVSMATELMNEEPSPKPSRNASGDQISGIELKQVDGNGTAQQRGENGAPHGVNTKVSASATAGVKGHVYRDSGVEIDDIIISTV